MNIWIDVHLAGRGNGGHLPSDLAAMPGGMKILGLGNSTRLARRGGILALIALLGFFHFIFVAFTAIVLTELKNLITFRTVASSWHDAAGVCINMK